MACDPMLADILFLVRYSPLTSVDYGECLLLYERTQSQGAKGAFVLPSGTPRRSHGSAVRRLMCYYQLGGFDFWA